FWKPLSCNNLHNIYIFFLTYCEKGFLWGFYIKVSMYGKGMGCMCRGISLMILCNNYVLEPRCCLYLIDISLSPRQLCGRSILRRNNIARRVSS
ncbi:MAG: hypothetical protein ACXWFB_10285, partial [Nitrososphaeraceae archaeon]